MLDSTRRRFLSRTPLAGAALRAGALFQIGATARAAGTDEKPALLGGPKARRQSFDSWPKFDLTEEKAILDVLRSGRWYRNGGGQQVVKFEQAFAALTGAPQVLATNSGTSALIVALHNVGVEAGDEVVVPAYTFIATINAVLRANALPVFVDTDPETFQIDASKVEGAISPATRALVPVHLGGNVCDLDTLAGIAARHNVPLIEDACQAHLAEWKGRKVGTYGTVGCFSFQASKNLNSGEGGAVLFRDAAAREKAFAFHSNSYTVCGGNFRLTEFQGALLLAQMARLEAQARTRSENAKYLTSMLREIPGITPARQYPGTTNNAYHLYMLRYNPEAFAGLPRDKFLKALAAEGIPASHGYNPLNTEKCIRSVVESRGYAKLFPAARLKQWRDANHCPQNDKLCSEAVWMTQNMLLGTRSDMEQIADAFRKIHAHAGALV